jgi:hypothetical protein
MNTDNCSHSENDKNEVSTKNALSEDDIMGLCESVDTIPSSTLCRAVIFLFDLKVNEDSNLDFLSSLKGVLRYRKLNRPYKKYVTKQLPHHNVVSITICYH